MEERLVCYYCGKEVVKGKGSDEDMIIFSGKNCCSDCAKKAQKFVETDRELDNLNEKYASSGAIGHISGWVFIVLLGVFTLSVSNGWDGYLFILSFLFMPISLAVSIVFRFRRSRLRRSMTKILERKLIEER